MVPSRSFKRYRKVVVHFRSSLTSPNQLARMFFDAAKSGRPYFLWSEFYGMEKIDALILLKNELLSIESQPLILKFDNVDMKLGFEPGTSKTYLREAAAMARFEVLHEGESLAELRRLPPESIRLVRA